MASDIIASNMKLNEGNPQVTQDMFIQIASDVPFATDADIAEALTLVPKDKVF